MWTFPRFLGLLTTAQGRVAGGGNHITAGAGSLLCVCLRGFSPAALALWQWFLTSSMREIQGFFSYFYFLRKRNYCDNLCVIKFTHFKSVQFNDF